MSKKNKQAIPSAERAAQEAMLDALLGADDDFYDVEAATEFLDAVGIDSSKLVSDFKSFLQTEVRHFEAERKPVPPALNDALQSLRAEIKASDPMTVDPQKWFGGLLGGMLPIPVHQAAPSLRRREGEDITAEDIEILETFKDEIEEDQK